MTDDAKDQHRETSEQLEDAAIIALPASLASMSDADRAALGRRATVKMDIVIMPILVVMYILNYLDRQNIASAKLANIEEDLGLSDVQYQTSVSILFCGYILMQVPSNMLAGRITWPGTYICLGMAAWGVVSACMAAVHSFAGLLVARVLLGIIEAIFFPGAMFFLSMFYTRRQLAFRTAILYSGSQLGNAFGGLFAVAILELDGAHGLQGWRWLFLIEGVATTGLALIFALILPNSSKKILGLSSTECDWVQWNFSSDQGQVDDPHEVSAYRGLIMAIKDVKTWLLLGILYCTYIVGAVVNFFPSVVGGLGYGRNTTYLLTAPPFILCVLCMLVSGWHSDRVAERFWHVSLPLVVTLAANVIAVSTVNIAARYTAMMLLPGSFYASAVVTLSWIAGTLGQPSAKRASAIAIINAFANTPNIWCSYLYYSEPRYLTAFIVNVAATGLAIAFAVATRVRLRRDNGRLDRGEDLGVDGPTASQVAAGFRYRL